MFEGPWTTIKNLYFWVRAFKNIYFASCMVYANNTNRTFPFKIQHLANMRSWGAQKECVYWNTVVERVLWIRTTIFRHEELAVWMCQNEQRKIISDDKIKWEYICVENSSQQSWQWVNESWVTWVTKTWVSGVDPLTHEYVHFVQTAVFTGCWSPSFHWSTNLCWNSIN